MTKEQTVTWPVLLDKLAKTPDLPNDPEFPNRPDSESFRLMSRIARALDGLADEFPTAMEDVVGLLGTDPASVDYLAMGRVKRALQAINFRIGATQEWGAAAAWMDGWVAGALYANERHYYEALQELENDND